MSPTDAVRNLLHSFVRNQLLSCRDLIHIMDLVMDEVRLINGDSPLSDPPFAPELDVENINIANLANSSSNSQEGGAVILQFVPPRSGPGERC
jgi:hypothetical protein